MGLPTKGLGSPSISWTYEGDVDEAAKWLPYAVGLLRTYADKGLPKGNNTPVEGVSINFDAMTGRIHIQAGGNKLYIHLLDLSKTSLSVTSRYALLFRNPSPPNAFGTVGTTSNERYSLTGSVLSATNIYAVESIKHDRNVSLPSYWRSRNDAISWLASSGGSASIAYRGIPFFMGRTPGGRNLSHMCLASAAQTAYYFSQVGNDVRTKYSAAHWAFAFLILSCSTLDTTQGTPYGFTFSFLPVYSRNIGPTRDTFEYSTGVAADALECYVPNNLFYRNSSTGPNVSVAQIGFSEKSNYFFLYTTEAVTEYPAGTSSDSLGGVYYTNKIIRITILPATSGAWSPLVESIKTHTSTNFYYIITQTGDSSFTPGDINNNSSSSWVDKSTAFFTDHGNGRIESAGLSNSTKNAPSYFCYLYKDRVGTLVNTYHATGSSVKYSTSFPVHDASWTFISTPPYHTTPVYAVPAGAYVGFTASSSGSRHDLIDYEFTDTLKLGRINIDTKAELMPTDILTATGSFLNTVDEVSDYFATTDDGESLKAQIRNANADRQIAAQDMDVPLIPYPYNPNGHWPMSRGTESYSLTTSMSGIKTTASISVCNFDGGVFYASMDKSQYAGAGTNSSYSYTINPQNPEVSNGHASGGWTLTSSDYSNSTGTKTHTAVASIRNTQGQVTQTLSSTTESIPADPSEYGSMRLTLDTQLRAAVDPTAVLSVSVSIGTDWADNGDVMVKLNTVSASEGSVDLVNSHSQNPMVKKTYQTNSPSNVLSISTIRK